MVMSLPAPLAHSLGVLWIALSNGCGVTFPPREHCTCSTSRRGGVGLAQSFPVVALSGGPRCKEGRLPSLCVLAFKQECLT